MSGSLRERLTAVVLLLVLGFYCLTIGWRGVLLVGDGRPAAVLLGLGVIVVPLVVVAAVWRLVAFARDGAQMMTQLRALERRNAVDADSVAGLGAPQGGTGRHQDWLAWLVEAERNRQAGLRAAEQAAYRQAVRAWRAQRARPSGARAQDVP